MEIPYLAKESYINYGELWLKMSDQYRAGYIRGFVGGMDLWGIKILPILTSKIEEGLLGFEEEETILELLNFRLYLASLAGDVDGVHSIIKVVADLYEDPANTYIPSYKMIEFAYQKLKGENIEPLLQEARKKAFQNQ